MLDSGPSQKVTDRQAADIQFAIGRSHEEDGRIEQAEAAYVGPPCRATRAAPTPRPGWRSWPTARATRPARPLHFDLALKIDPSNPEILCDRGYGLYLRRRFAEAEASLRAAIAADRSHARSHNNLGLVLAARGDKDAALAEFVRAGCDRSDARANLALVLAMQGKLPEAKRAVRPGPGREARLARRHRGPPGRRDGPGEVPAAVPASGPPRSIASADLDAGPRHDASVSRTSLERGDPDW